MGASAAKADDNAVALFTSGRAHAHMHADTTALDEGPADDARGKTTVRAACLSCAAMRLDPVSFGYTMR